MKKVSKQNFLTNKFSRSKTNRIIDILNQCVDASTTASDLMNLLPEEANEFCWYAGDKPAYHVQYQVDSVAILKVNNFILIVWKPKYIQYPSMVQFPQMSDKKLQTLKLQVDQSVTNMTQGNLTALLQFLTSFISNFRKDEDFQTNLVTYTKHFVSKKTAVCYWHCIYDDADKAILKDQNKMACIAKINVTGVKKTYNKSLLIFSCKGERDGILSMITKKWMQALSFLAMVMIFVSVVTCSPDDKEGVCQYRDEAMIGGAGLMMGLFGLKLANRKKKQSQKKEKTKTN